MKGQRSAKKERTGTPLTTHAPTEKAKNRRQAKQKEAAPPSPYRETEDGLHVRELFCHEGVAILEWVADFPIFTTHGAGKKGKKRIARANAFYKTMAEKADLYARGGLLSALVRQYEKDPDPRKRYRHARVRLSVTHSVERRDERFAAVQRQICVARAGKVLVSREESELFDLLRGRICPPERKKSTPMKNRDG